MLGRGGDDFLNGSGGADSIFGGEGQDVVIANANNAIGRDIAHGGAGDDVVYGSFSDAEYFGGSQLFGDAGADVFAFMPFGVPDKIMDFNLAEDRIALYFSHYALIDPLMRSFDAVAPKSVVETAEILKFTINARAEECGCVFHDFVIKYNKTTGNLSWTNISYSVDDWHVFAKVVGAPDLDISNFATITDLLA